MNNKTAIVVISCQKFNQAWAPFFILMKKYWNDCPFKSYLVTDYGNYKETNTICLNEDLGFSSNLKKALEMIKEDYVIYFQEDYFIYSKVDTTRIENYIEHMKEHNIACLRLAPCPGPTAPWRHEKSLGVLEPGEPYRISTQTAIWRKDFLISLLHDGETGRDFEIKGSQRVNGMKETLLSVWRDETPIPYIITGIVRGKWLDESIELLEREGIPTEHINKVIE